MNASCDVRRKIVKLTFNHSYTNSGNPQHLFTKIVATNKLQIMQNDQIDLGDQTDQTDQTDQINITTR